MLKAQKVEGWQVVEVNTALEFCVPVLHKRRSWKGKKYDARRRWKVGKQ